MADITFTVFTATYNRATTLPRVYASLCAQTFRDFEWLIVDDGSTDNTRELVASWQATFPVRYFYQPNNGKHVAYNRGAQAAQGRYWLNLDSDDAAAPEALERFAAHWEALAGNETFAAVGSLCRYANGALVGDEFPRSPFDAGRAELRYRYGVKGDKWLSQRAEVVRRFPFPEPPGVKFVQERAVLAQISAHYRTRYFNEALKIVHLGEERLSDNLTRHPLGVALGQRSVLNYEMAWLPYAPLHFARTAANYTRLAYLAGHSAKWQWTGLNTYAARVLWLLLWLPGMILGQIDKLKG